MTHYCFGWMLQFFLLRFADDFNLIALGKDWELICLGFIVLMLIYEAPLSWGKTRGGLEYV